jgi:hypothetical protein
VELFRKVAKVRNVGMINICIVGKARSCAFRDNKKKPNIKYDKIATFKCNIKS